MNEGFVEVFVICLVAICVHGNNSHFPCYGDICNRENADQFCSSIFGYCRNCAEIADDCGKKEQPLNCTSFCADYLLTLKLEAKKAANCVQVPNITNGNVNVTNENEILTNGTRFYYQGDALEITCKPGYKLQFKGLIHCSSFGEFRYESPTCIAITCKPPPRVLNGNIHKDSTSNVYKIGQSVSFICDSGYSLYGTKSMTCTEDGLWAASDDSTGYSLLCLKDRPNGWMFGFFVITGLVITFFLYSGICTIRKRKRKDTTVFALLINRLCKWHRKWTIYSSVSTGTEERNISTSSVTKRKQIVACRKYLPSTEAVHDEKSATIDTVDENQPSETFYSSTNSIQLLTQTAIPNEKTPGQEALTSVGAKTVKSSVKTGALPISVIPDPVHGKLKSPVKCSEVTFNAEQPQSAQGVCSCVCYCDKSRTKPRPEL